MMSWEEMLGVVEGKREEGKECGEVLSKETTKPRPPYMDVTSPILVNPNANTNESGRLDSNPADSLTDLVRSDRDIPAE